MVRAVLTFDRLDLGAETFCSGFAAVLIPVFAAFLLTGCATTEPDRTNGSVGTAPMAPLAEERVIALAEQAIERKRYDDAKGLIQRILASAPNNKHAKILWGELLLRSGAAGAAIAYFDEMSDDPVLGARALQGKGLALIRMGKSDEAQGQLEKAVRLHPTLWRAWNALGFCYDTAGDWTLSSDAYTKAIGLNPASAALFNNRGYSLLLQSRINEAISDFAKALNLDSQLKIAEVNLRLAMAWSGQYERAVLGSGKGELRQVLNNVGYVAMLKGDLVAAEGLLIRAVEADAAYNKTAHENLAYLRALKKTRMDPAHKKSRK